MKKSGNIDLSILKIGAINVRVLVWLCETNTWRKSNIMLHGYR